MDEKTKDRVKILRYISSIKEPIVSVPDIERHSGADKLRVSPILYELFLSGALAPCSYTFWGIADGYYVQKSNL